MSQTNAGEGPPGSGMYRTRLERTLVVVVVAVASIGMGYLFFTQLWWKLPPDFRCTQDFAFSEAGPEGNLVREPGLCGWIGIEAFYADQPRELFSADIVRDNDGAELSIPIGLAQQANGAFIENVVKPNIRWFGYVIWTTEAFIFLSLSLGFLSRLGALAAVGISGQLMIGLAGIPEPYEWEWSYQTIFILAVLLFGLAPGRYFGLDRLLRRRLFARREEGQGGFPDRLLLLLT
ncbi:hypothetical protein [Rubrobacter indicoceani]|uniref:hypothetical protein n=1 Tax=Rubrobacter indicoceani TaxID=2051957 RepID=UPI000E5C175E|nr:hypothetical protein [Rubrobacter indicoceani]